MIGPAPILGSVLGTNAPKTNNCDMRTSGWELEIGWRDPVSYTHLQILLQYLVSCAAPDFHPKGRGSYPALQPQSVYGDSVFLILPLLRLKLSLIHI